MYLSVNTTSNGTTRNAHNAIAKAIFAGMLLDLLTVFFSPLILGQMFQGSARISGERNNTIHKFVWISFVTILSQFTSFLIFAITSITNVMQLFDSVYILCLEIGALSALCFNYLFIKFATLFLLGTIMNNFITKCFNADSLDIAADVKSCLTEFLLKISNAGPILLILLAIDSLLVMLYSFMIYLTYSTGSYIYMLCFVLSDVHVICSLIYICILCDDCSTALKTLLIPLRSFLRWTL